MNHVKDPIVEAKRSPSLIRDDILWGWLWTGGMAVAAGVVVGLQYAFRGPELLENLGIGLDQLVVVYAAGAFLGGIVLGLLRPYARTRLGGGLLGFLLAFALYLPIGYLMDRSEDVSVMTTILSAAAISVIFGIPAGLYFSRYGFGGD